MEDQNWLKLFSFITKNKIMSCEIKLRCANTTTIYVSRIQNQTVSDVILQVCMYIVHAIKILEVQIHSFKNFQLFLA